MISCANYMKKIVLKDSPANSLQNKQLFFPKQSTLYPCFLTLTLNKLNSGIHRWEMSAIKNTSNNLATLALLACVSLSLIQVRGAGTSGASLLLPTLAGVISGCAALAWLRPQRVGLSPPNVMLSLGIGGMLLGLFWDTTRVPLAVLDALCVTNSPAGLLDSMIFHANLFPGMHALMVIGGISAIPTLRRLRPECRRLCSMLTQNILCSSWMLVGMTLGSTLFVQSIRSINGIAVDKMLGGMFAGMVWGMVISVGLYRLFFVIRDRFDQTASILPLNKKG